MLSDLHLDLISKLKDLGKWDCHPQFFLTCFPNTDYNIVLAAILFFSMTCRRYLPFHLSIVFVYPQIHTSFLVRLPVFSH